MIGWVIKTSIVIGIVFVVYYLASSYINKENKLMDDEQLTMKDMNDNDGILPEPTEPKEKNAEEKNVEEKNAEEKNAEEKNAEEKNVEEKNKEEKNVEEKNKEAFNS